MKSKTMFKKFLYLSSLIFVLLLLPAISHAAPKLFFSDLDSGPKTGWEGSATKGAAVTVWGTGFGTTRGSGTITVNGAQLTSASDYAEWGTTGLANGIPRGLERTTFWIPSSAADGAGTITVTINGETSNSLQFTVRSGNIYFISVNNGSDSNNGRYSSAQGGGNGPWRKMAMALNSNNSIITFGDTIYVRAGTYTEQDQDGAIMRARGDYGVAGRPIAIVGYPGEVPVIDMANIPGTKRGVFSVEECTYSTCGTNLGHGADYFTIAKLKAINGADAFDPWGVGNRIIGNHLQNNLDESWSGVIMVDTSEDMYIYGNYFEHNGYDMFKHNIYVATTVD